MFHSNWPTVGRFYFPDESDEIKRTMEQRPCTEDVAAVQVLGLTFEDLGIGIARTWGSPT